MRDGRHRSCSRWSSGRSRNRFPREPPKLVLVLNPKIRYTFWLRFRDAGFGPRCARMSTRQPAQGQSLQQPQPLSQRMLAGLFLFVVCVLVTDALVGDQGLLATIRARKEYNQLANDLARLRTENAALREEAR